MLTLQMLKSLSEQGIAEYISEYCRELVLTDRRLEALQRRQKREPTWESFDPVIQEVVGIGIRIEEQLAVKDELSSQLALLGTEVDRRRGLNQTIRMM